jgi:hypothetical protein
MSPTAMKAKNEPTAEIKPPVTVIRRALFDFKINYFRPLGGIVPISASLSRTEGDPKIFQTDGKNLTIILNKAEANDLIELSFRLPSTDYLLIGIAFASSLATYVGQVEFPVIDITTCFIPDFPSIPYRRMTVHDDVALTRNDVRFGYIILVQSVATGEIGIIDPDIETELTE